MRESNTLVCNATIKYLEMDILLDTKGQYNGTIKQLQRKILVDSKGQYVKESNMLVGNGTIKQLRMDILIDTQGSIYEGIKYSCQQYKQHHQSAVHERVRYLCSQCIHQATTKAWPPPPDKICSHALCAIYHLFVHYSYK